MVYYFTSMFEKLNGRMKYKFPQLIYVVDLMAMRARFVQKLNDWRVLVLVILPAATFHVCTVRFNQQTGEIIKEK